MLQEVYILPHPHLENFLTKTFGDSMVKEKCPRFLLW